MFSAIRRRATYANVAMTLALVFAMTGGAYAAKKYLITSTKQISPSVLKSLVGKAGPAGAQGVAGPQGAQGPGGTAGAKGETGAEGKEGPQGPAGSKGPTGATGSAGTPGLKGTNGTNGSNGATGATGPQGEPWTAGGTLPKGSVETGSWSMPAGSPPQFATISFPIALAAAIPAGNVEYVAKGATPPASCENSEHAGTASPENPEAAKGFLCVFAAAGSVSGNVMVIQMAGSEGFAFGASTAGAILVAGETVTGGAVSYFGGTWAVTAP